MAYSPEFRLEAAQLVVNQGYKIKAACDAMGVGKSTLENQIRRHRKERQSQTPKGAAMTQDKRRIAEWRLQQENQEVKLRGLMLIDS